MLFPVVLGHRKDVFSLDGKQETGSYREPEVRKLPENGANKIEGEPVTHIYLVFRYVRVVKGLNL